MNALQVAIMKAKICRNIPAEPPKPIAIPIVETSPVNTEVPVRREPTEIISVTRVDNQTETDDAPPAIPTPVLLKRILRQVAEAHKLTVNDLQCAGRQKPLVLARREFCYRAATETKASLPQIGRCLGDRDHTTVMNALAVHCVFNELPHPRGSGDNTYVRKALEKRR